ncbi:hypothetical protein LTR37_002960, partial [Vermiconidia calcicola]
QGGSYFVVLQHIAWTEDHNPHNYSSVFGIYETAEAARAAMKVWSIDVDRYGFAIRSPVEVGTEPRYLEGTVRNGFNEAVGEGYRVNKYCCRSIQNYLNIGNITGVPSCAVGVDC